MDMAFFIRLSMALLIRLIMALFTRLETGLFHPTLTTSSMVTKYPQYFEFLKVNTEE